MNIKPLTPNEARKAKLCGIFTVTSETATGYYVTCLKFDGDRLPSQLSQSKECVRPSTARQYAAKLVREALRGRR